MADDLKGSATRAGLNGAGLKIGIVQSRFNPKIVSALLAACIEELNRSGIVGDDIVLFTVPGALEIPLLLQELASTQQFDGLIALGCVIRGDTYHFEVVCNESARAISELQLQYQIPVANAVLTTENEQQAEHRAIIKGKESAQVVLEMVLSLKRIRSTQRPPERKLSA
ncbi:6,7-dimethyl-8-ribityllumazine synthase [Methylophaga lonarensis]|uniref:6,7-dimethyl-8-ribityllumazine synthase n=1 Tax=Methylophaga lonarensis TaxID=999151 RepID=UPI003D2D83EB